jgi:hypothetical protein
MKQLASFVIAFCCLGSSALAQVSPSAIAPGVVPVPRGFQYAFRYSESAQTRTAIDTAQSSNVSGSVKYGNADKEKPFTMEYAGGYTWNLAGPDYQSGQFHRMNLTQGFVYRRWQLNLADNVSFLPQSPTTGFSGVPGTGEIIGVPNPNPSTSQTILTVNTHVLDNYAQGSLEHTLDYSTSLLIGGVSDVLHYPDGNGIEGRSTGANATLFRRLTARTSIDGDYKFIQYGYPGTNLTIYTQTGLAGLQHLFTRNLSVNLQGGPQWINSTNLSVVQANLTYVANASITYVKKRTSLGGSYLHDSNGGSGYLLGAIVDNAQGNIEHHFGQVMTLGITGGYSRTSPLSSNNNIAGAYGAVQGMWQLGRLILFANYTGAGQSTSSTLPSNVLNQTLNNFSFGFGLSSKEARVRQP